MDNILATRKWHDPELAHIPHSSFVPFNCVLVKCVSRRGVMSK